MQPTPPSGSTSFIASILEKLGKVVRSVARRRGGPFQDFNEVSQRVSLDLARYPDNIPYEPGYPACVLQAGMKECPVAVYPNKIMVLPDGGGEPTLVCCADEEDIE